MAKNRSNCIKVWVFDLANDLSLHFYIRVKQKKMQNDVVWKISKTQTLFQTINMLEGGDNKIMKDVKDSWVDTNGASKRSTRYWLFNDSVNYTVANGCHKGMQYLRFQNWLENLSC